MPFIRKLTTVCMALTLLASLPPMYGAFAASKVVTARVDRQGDGYVWSMQSPIKIGLVQVSLLLKDEKGKPLVGREISGSIRMPTMPMEGYPAELAFNEDKDGRYLALVQYPHGGYWEITATVADEQGRKHTQTFGFDLPMD
ncbi:MAG: FixH family protein [Desulfovibrio sp.]|jgi:hypothetical protein|nr:FixH family protein [Desulfovibrio sp.]